MMPSGLPPSGMPPNGMPPSGMPPNGAPPNGAPPTGMPPSGMQQSAGMPPQGMPPTGMPTGPGGMPQQGMPTLPFPGYPGMPPMGYPGMPPIMPPPTPAPDSRAAPSVVLPPNPTLYVNNINEKIKMDELKKALFHVFSQFGAIIEISAFKDLRRRGQAWVVFETLASATKAFTEMANFSFYGKPLQVSYSRAKSDVVSKKDDSFVPRPLRKAPKKRRLGKKSKKEKKDKKDGKREKKDREDQPGSTTDGHSAEQDNSAQQMPVAPNRILFVENLPKQTNDMTLSMLFQQYPGFKEARLVNGRPGIAFVEFDDASQSAIAKQALHNFKITPTNNMKVTFARQ